MTRPSRATQAEIKRAIRAARSAGLAVSGVTIAPDGTIAVLSGDLSPLIPAHVPAETTEDWESR